MRWSMCFACSGSVTPPVLSKRGRLPSAVCTSCGVRRCARPHQTTQWCGWVRRIHYSCCTPAGRRGSQRESCILLLGTWCGQRPRSSTPSTTGQVTFFSAPPTVAGSRDTRTSRMAPCSTAPRRCVVLVCVCVVVPACLQLRPHAPLRLAGALRGHTYTPHGREVLGRVRQVQGNAVLYSPDSDSCAHASRE